VNKNVGTVTCQLANYALERWRRLVLLFQLCEMYVENNVPWSRQVEFDDDSSDTDSD